MELDRLIETTGKALDVVGIAVMLVGVLVASAAFMRGLRRGQSFTLGYRSYRQGLGRAILLGLEFLVAADIIRTIAVSPTFYSVGVLGLIVVIRTFLSFSLELEIDGRWPWQREPGSAVEPDRADR
jgi:uncharacterized membrane protein